MITTEAFMYMPYATTLSRDINMVTKPYHQDQKQIFILWTCTKLDQLEAQGMVHIAQK